MASWSEEALNGSTESPVVQKPPRTSCVTAVGKRIRSFDGVKIGENCSNLDLSQNRITDFVGMPKLDMLVQLNLDENRIVSFEGCEQCRRLKWVSLRKNPVSHTGHFKLMCLVAFGKQLKYVNGEKIPDKTRTQADGLRDILLPALREGQLLISVKPLRLIDAKVEQDENRMNTGLSGGFSKRSIREISQGSKTLYVNTKSSIASLCDAILEMEEVPMQLAKKISRAVADIRDLQNDIFLGISADSRTQVSDLAEESEEEDSLEANMDYPKFSDAREVDSS
jgi:hypothetical protein